MYDSLERRKFLKDGGFIGLPINGDIKNPISKD
jgi:hypothetical protein